MLSGIGGKKTVVMKYVTIWSRINEKWMWVIERTHTQDYCKSLIGISEIGQIVPVNGREYGVFGEGVNPNVKTFKFIVWINDDKADVVHGSYVIIKEKNINTAISKAASFFHNSRHQLVIRSLQ